jgi:hypothetical protein
MMRIVGGGRSDIRVVFNDTPVTIHGEIASEPPGFAIRSDLPIFWDDDPSRPLSDADRVELFRELEIECGKGGNRITYWTPWPIGSSSLTFPATFGRA